MATTTPRILSIGGLDPCGGAGITADARAIQARGGFPLTVATCLTVQNRHGLQSLGPVEPQVFRATLQAALADGPLQAIKLGLMGSPALFPVLHELLLPSQIPLVVDPVLAATAGGAWVQNEWLQAYRELLPVVSLLTPNLQEYELLMPEDCAAVLLKGGHSQEDPVRDVLHRAQGQQEFAHPRLDCGPVHGTGCALASFITVYLAKGLSLDQACGKAIADLQRCLQLTRPSNDAMPVPLQIR